MFVVMRAAASCGFIVGLQIRGMSYVPPPTHREYKYTYNTLCAQDAPSLKAGKFSSFSFGWKTHGQLWANANQLN